MEPLADYIRVSTCKCSQKIYKPCNQVQLSLLLLPFTTHPYQRTDPGRRLSLSVPRQPDFHCIKLIPCINSTNHHSLTRYATRSTFNATILFFSLTTMRSSILISLALASYVSAHGWVQSITINGQSYDGPKPTENGGSGAGSVIRQISTANPVKGADNKNLACGQDAKPASKQASANPGDSVEIKWTSASGNWFHNVGPMLTYMASCGSSSCSSFDASDAKWFKIDEAGADSSGQWAQDDLTKGQPAKVKIPDNLKAGNYLLRHEIISLQGAASVGGAEFYPSCAQVKVGGDGTASPSSDELVSLPGAYKDTDKGIELDVYTNFKASAYKFPGPAVAKLVAGSGSGSSSSSSDSSASSSSSSSGSSSSSNTGSSSHNNGSSGSSGADAAGSGSGSSGSSNDSGSSSPSSSSVPESTPAAPSPAAPSASASASSGSSSGACRNRRSSSVPKMKRERAASSNDTVEQEIKRVYESALSRAIAARNEENVKAYKPRHMSRVMRSVGSTNF
ncbi:hypothetical protein D9758_012751 [Tetrapyrgos nigripes]|uniref:lytic cellulose monooxygenase (C4-dehydrogenating) n=1 Tax=Tetrapyrgos nigripes TaxID=182062 RepID=A0A8H5CQY2_9AGAR|nr:hypothetical protein D9758_012751 [Tetrapyrgos nigripes]